MQELANHVYPPRSVAQEMKKSSLEGKSPQTFYAILRRSKLSMELVIPTNALSAEGGIRCPHAVSMQHGRSLLPKAPRPS